ncbi:protein FAR1-RELATED SEQUENCE 5-like [Silene latifolia]|uniref:protein FAR1-RELATED SEQUENCE 5-like n=1 Tax=Silene latifolia TaxID=37657 RepID=UPI003D78117B
MAQLAPSSSSRKTGQLPPQGKLGTQEIDEGVVEKEVSPNAKEADADSKKVDVPMEVEKEKVKDAEDAPPKEVIQVPFPHRLAKHKEKGTQQQKWRGGEIKSKLFVCNREGFAQKKPSKDRDDGLVGGKLQRIFRVTRVGCKARIRLYMKNGLLLIDRFHEGHNHELISLKDREFQKFSRNITDYHKMIIVSNSKLKIGPTKTYRICKEQVNGFENIGASLNDFKNFHRDVKCFIHERMEDYESFNWVFSRFLQAMGGKEPEYIITDQDPGIIKSVPLVFKTERHQFCMWHIMNKMPSKFGVSRSDYNDFMCKINDIIWDDELEAAEFDGIWEQIIEDHGVGVNDWFADTYAIRGQWVMAHCRDLRMASIMRTTQRSESENSFFKRFEHKSGILFEFWMRFESAMDQQRHTQKQLDNMDKHSSAAASTHLALEIHAAKVYTYSAFQKFKEEAIFSIDTCRTGGFTERGELEVTTVKDSSRKKNFEVAYSPGKAVASQDAHPFTEALQGLHHLVIRALIFQPVNTTNLQN